MRRVADMEQQRAALLDEIERARTQVQQSQAARVVTPAEVRLALRELLDGIAQAEDARREPARLALAEMLDRVEVDPEARPPFATLHYALQRGDMLATPRVDQVSPLRWTSGPVALGRKRG